MKKKSIGVIFLMLCCVLLGGCFNNTVKQKEYSSNGFHVKMEDGMYEKDLATATAAFMNDKVVVTALKEEFSILEAIDINKDSKIEDYANAVIKNNKADYELKEKDGLSYFEYEQTVNGKDFYYLATLYKSDDAFWLVNFACEKSNKDSYQEAFMEWAKTVTFDK